MSMVSFFFLDTLALFVVCGNDNSNSFLFEGRAKFFSGSIEREGIFPHLCLYSIESLRVQSKYLL